ncbi:hypothetical protein [Thermoplasma acidophilum]|uniref:Aminotransferase class V-fold PLP-dependent enzyme n=1 Tax=Thermoplasma acidophilum (strain ATCC 25905 / DSM 1728 / JCM 9062 / NBRC 15155 / AMRC-C165) TaxID=273075 RepID=Q9HKC8_THEAC|nr:aminotransferase class V-fold PLP-dependent enzyme [Thermoplasma acidophilum]CAC11811.1 hypothetical protein [Thermoplasma acidophilum]
MIDDENSILTDFLKFVRSMRVVNGIGTMTFLGGNTVSDEIIESMKYVSDIFINMQDFSRIAGEYIARRLGVEAAYITAGAAAGTVLGLASLLSLKTGARYIKDIIEEGRKMVVAVQRPHKTEFRDLIYMAGPGIIEFGDEGYVSEQSLEETIKKHGKNILAVLHYELDPMDGALPLESVIRIAHSYNVPVIVDAAAEIPPKGNLTRYLKMGSDLVLYSGGKMLGGLSNSGLMVGRKDIIMMAQSLGPFSEENGPDGTRVFIGRPMKISKEIIVATVAAVERFLTFNDEDWLRKQRSMADNIAKMISDIDQEMTVRVVDPGWNHPRPVAIPRVEISFENGMSADEVCSRLKNFRVPIYTYSLDGKLYLNPQCLKEDDVPIIIDGLSSIVRAEKGETRWRN